MPKQICRTGGFAGQNSGNVTDCYSIVELRGKNAGGFVGNHTGLIERSFRMGALRDLTGGFFGSGNGQMASSYFFHYEKENSKHLKKVQDPLYGQRISEIKDVADIKQLGFDTDHIWEYTDGKPLLKFNPESWMYDLGKSPRSMQLIETPILIETAEQLWEFANQINEGERALSESYVQLTADIDLGGKEWVPIGKDRTRAFTGLFDGAGHTVKNFVIKDKNTENKGFFGFCKGEIYNLTVDCRIKGGGCAGGLVAQCDGGIIGCCAAIVEIVGKDGCYGGLVGVNTGTIFQSYAAGRVVIAGIWWLPWLLGSTGFLLLLLAVLVLRFPDRLPAFAPVPYDKDQVPIPDATIAPNTDGNYVSFQFEQDITVNLSTGLCKFGFQNPGNSNHNIVVQLQFTDAQAIRVLGSTGRTQNEQKKLESNPGYNPETYRTVIAESGAIQPGYKLEDLRLVAQPNGATIPPGSYNAMVYLVFYDIKTNERAMLESQLPVVINVS